MVSTCTVKDHYKRLEELRHLTEIKLASKSRNSKLQKIKEGSYALVIQKIWRGCKCRDHIKAFLNERKLWIERRIADTHHRKKIMYQVACFFGNGALLDSDTPIETVMKRVPFWARSTVKDVIRGRCTSAQKFSFCTFLSHSTGIYRWVEFALYVKEQEDFKIRNGPVHTSVYLSLAVAQRHLKLKRQSAAYKAKKAKKEYEVGQEAYRRSESLYSIIVRRA